MNTTNQMNHNLTLSLTKTIPSSLERIWEILTTPKYIKQYLYDTDVISEWKEGSSLIFKGVWEGTPYEEKGKIIVLQRPQTFKYSYFSEFFGLPDLPENYSIIENKLTFADGFVTIHLTQTGFTAEDRREHSLQSWKQCLDIIEGIAKTLN
ncbi:SRPBCC domain-containing protein [Leptospira sp. 2 VSF19]|uniref:SRPBCC domain-containing protein n=1 Tax=Leptospira soteropolitanensis TaxID=2950025 RepID=A0AAW5VHI4_9LEPT|nr:SRPBCC domain-containing protein [Leptospira soteropolitanensis]MCW7491938.1 SRPBCC domain-containing protein [Leptospira soteropolitanensis]MCW7499522.1 SRPBCC domain-containing protein [Leptospira soteropolitanensis]MCW7520887.1 SRPBCC domain-containing protein [Leptospira soteropolitanensis]MCW7525626.1 SRPBCC domain-containing protein [Leptospira soteropolitanensis]MCW7529492.1 SRPBCC domain-containing protein [Leptospira soteropolitanensis]